MKMFKHIAFASIIAMGISGTADADSDEENCSDENRSYKDGFEVGKAEGIAECQEAGTTASCPHVDTHALFSLSEGTLQMPLVEVSDDKGITTYQVEMKLISSGAENEFTFSVSSATPIESEDTPPSSSDDLRFTDNGDGTVTDNLSGLIWLKNANCFGKQKWDKAKKSASELAEEQCGLTDGSAEGDWRLPNVYELQSLISHDYSRPALSNAAGTEQWNKNDAFSNVQANSYWSSTTFADNADNAWHVGLSDGWVGSESKKTGTYVWPVRDVKSATTESVETPAETSENAGSAELSEEAGSTDTQTDSTETGESNDPEESVDARYTDNDDGTVTDNNTKLVWLKNANCFGEQDWDTAMNSAAKLANEQCELSDGSKAGDWRLPTKEEWEKVVDDKDYSINVLEDAFSSVQASAYWSSTTYAGFTSFAWYVDLDNGSVGADGKRSTGYVWPVRGGQIDN